MNYWEPEKDQQSAEPIKQEAEPAAEQSPLERMKACFAPPEGAYIRGSSYPLETPPQNTNRIEWYRKWSEIRCEGR